MGPDIIVSAWLVFMPLDMVLMIVRNVISDCILQCFLEVWAEGAVILAGASNGHWGSAEGYERQPRGCGFGARNKEEERILEFYTAINITVRNAF